MQDTPAGDPQCFAGAASHAHTIQDPSAISYIFMIWLAGRGRLLHDVLQGCHTLLGWHSRLCWAGALGARLLPLQPADQAQPLQAVQSMESISGAWQMVRVCDRKCVGYSVVGRDLNMGYTSPSLKVWRRAVSTRKVSGAREALTKNHFLLHPVFRGAILKVRSGRSHSGAG